MKHPGWRLENGLASGDGWTWKPCRRLPAQRQMSRRQERRLTLPRQLEVHICAGLPPHGGYQETKVPRLPESNCSSRTRSLRRTEPARLPSPTRIDTFPNHRPVPWTYFTLISEPRVDPSSSSCSSDTSWLLHETCDWSSTPHHSLSAVSILDCGRCHSFSTESRPWETYCCRQLSLWYLVSGKPRPIKRPGANNKPLAPIPAERPTDSTNQTRDPRSGG